MKVRDGAASLSQVGINASNVNRSAFHMMPPESPDKAVFTPKLNSPGGVRKGSNEYLKLQLEEAKEKIRFLQEREVGPMESGILKVVSAQPKASKHRLTKSYGSVQLQDLHTAKAVSEAARVIEEKRLQVVRERRASNQSQNERKKARRSLDQVRWERVQVRRSTMSCRRPPQMCDLW